MERLQNYEYHRYQDSLKRSDSNLHEMILEEAMARSMQQLEEVREETVIHKIVELVNDAWLEGVNEDDVEAIT